LEILAQKHDVIAIQILDEAELKLPDAGVLNLYDPETGDTLYCNTSVTSIQKAYEARVSKQQEDLTKDLAKMKVDYIMLRSMDSHIKALRTFFEQRRRRLREGR
ncbi:MAG TPA: DUF58 domain-containing protein, partial [Candidatus Syntrophosphaera thermopropionivorans]|nr:DUF58 domain-containing protein [Candidatus Syntrophosphaera thermopropionivorans]